MNKACEHAHNPFVTGAKTPGTPQFTFISHFIQIGKQLRNKTEYETDIKLDSCLVPLTIVF